MRIKLLTLLFFLSFLCIYHSAIATPEISNVMFQPSFAWLGEDILISTQCTDNNETYNITKVYANIQGPDVLVSNFELDKKNDTYSRTLDHSYASKTGQYNVDIICENDNSENDTESGSFTISELTSSINSISPSPAYIEDEIEIDVFVKKDETDITSDVDFTVYLDDEVKGLKQDPPIYDVNDGWILKIDAPSSIGIFDLDVNAKYDRVEVTSSSQIEIKQTVDFELVNIDKTWVESNENVTLTFKALYKGSAITMEKEYLSISINAESVTIDDISQTNEYSYVKITMPSLSSGNYDLDIKFNYMDFVKEVSEEIKYVVPISGSIKNSDDKAIYTQITFKNNETNKAFITDSNGAYSGNIPPGVYEIHVDFPKAKLILSDVMINSFEDPIKFDNPSMDSGIPGIGTGGIFVFELALTYSDAYVEMKYDDSKILNEDEITLYKCDNWNFGRKTCNSNWVVLNPEIDTVRNLVKFNTTSLSAFSIGYKKGLYVEFDTDQDEYNLKEIIKITGIIQDEDGNHIPDVKITASVLNTEITASIISDSGTFHLEFSGPDSEGDYTVFVEAEKSPFVAANNSVTIKTVKSKKLSTITSSSIQLQQGESKTVYFSVINDGQTDFSDLVISLSGIPEKYYTISPTEISEIKAGEQQDISIDFNIPEDAAKDSYTGKFKVTYNEGDLEDQFIFTILDKVVKNETINKTTEGFKFPTLSLPTAKIVLPSITDAEPLIIIVIAVFSFTLSFLMRGRKVGKKLERENVTNLLLDIKREVERFPTKKTYLSKKKSKKIKRNKVRKRKKRK